MTKKKAPSGGLISSALALTALASTATAATVMELEPIIVSALRMPQESSTVTSTVTQLDPVELNAQGLRELRDALNASPGVISTSTAGQSGAVTSLFIRGTTTAESLVVIDGIRMNGAGNQLGNFLTTGRTRDIGSLEILRGPQSAIYGGESIGGVIWMTTPRGSGKPSSELTFETGSYGLLSGSATHQGQSGDLSYYLTGGYEETNNDAPESEFHQGSLALRVEALINDHWTVGTTHRMADNYYENGGTSDDRFDATLTTLYASGRHSDSWSSQYTLGYRREAYDSVSSFPYDNDLNAATLATDQIFRIHEDLRLIAGGFFTRESFKQDGYNSVDLENDRYGLYTAAELDVTDALTATGSLRWEDYESHGDELTWKLGSAYRIHDTGTRIHGSVGTAFRAPTYLDLFYENSFGYKGNPNLQPQESIGWDLGIEQEIGDHHSVDITYFRNLLENAIDSNKTPMPVNIPGTTATDGLELGFNGASPESSMSYRLAWTYLHHSLKDQPRNAATASVQWKPSDKATIGVGATHLSNRSWGGRDIAAYTTTRLFGSYDLTENVQLHARIENALNEDYELSNFGGTVTSGAGTGIYAGITINW